MGAMGRRIGWGLGPCLVSKNFQSYRIFGHIYGALNAAEKNNQLHSSTGNDEMNLLRLISP